MNIVPVFPQPFGFDSVTGDWQSLARKTLPVAKSHTQTDGNLHTQAEWKPLADQLIQKAQAYAKGLELGTVRISNMWLNSGGPGSAIHLHYHSNSIFSCIHYITATATSGTRFFNPIPMMLVPTHSKTNPFTWDDFTTKPENNQIVFFPSHLRHISMPAEQDRYTVSVNFVSDSYGSLAELNQG